MTEKLFNSKTLVLIDAGHGKETAGKRSPIWRDGSQLLEYDFNRKLASNFSQYLELGEISHIMLQDNDKDMPLSERVTLVNKLYAKYKGKYFVYLVSLHGNAADGIPRAEGVEVFTTKGDTSSDSIATKYYSELDKLGWKMRSDTSDKDPDKEENFFILKYTNCPAILTENGFYTNEEECKKMLSFYWQKQIALHHFNAALQEEQIH